MFKKTLVDCHARIDLPRPYWAREMETIAEELESEAKDLTAFLRDHRSRDAYGIEIVREYEVRCSFCGSIEETDDTGCPVCCAKAVEEWEGVWERGVKDSD